MSEDVLWQQWQASPTDDARNNLLLHYQPFIQHIAQRVGKRLPESIDWCDLVSEGQLAVVHCIGRYAPDSGVSFPNYAGRRIEGAMLDWLRQEDLLPDAERRSHKTLQRELESVRAQGPANSQEAAELTRSTAQQVESADAGTLGFLQDLARSRVSVDTEAITCLITLDHTGLYLVESPVYWTPIELSDVLDFGPRTCIPAIGEASRYYSRLRISPLFEYEWHCATVRTDCIPERRPTCKELRMSDLIDRVQLRISRKTAELEALQTLLVQLIDPLLADELADILQVATAPVPRKAVKRRTPSPITGRLVAFFEKNPGQAHTVQEVARGAGLRSEQARKALVQQDRFVKCDDSSNGILRYKLSSRA